VLPPAKRFIPQGVQWTRVQLEAMPGLCLHDLMLLPIDKLHQFFNSTQVDVAGADAQALHLLMDEIRTRLKYLSDVGIGYLTLDRQSRTLG
jgi:excinuclease ABC subunit A